MAAPPGAELAGVRKQVRAFWEEHADGFSRWWRALSVAERRKVLRAASIEMPATSKKASPVAAEYNKEDMSGEAGRALDRVSYVASAESVSDIAGKELEWVRDAYARKALGKRMPRPEELTQIVHVQPPDEKDFGTHYTVLVKQMPKEAVESFTKAVQAGFMADPVDFDYCFKRTGLLLAFCLSLTDYYRVEVLGGSADGPTPKCRTCAKTEGEGPEGRLLSCARCKSASYCSSACQKKDWTKHKVDCTPVKAEA
ncbi:hypothetical protein DFJ74DRAFT_705203 [Hyaloraphidium curvatum]|nr:hypothetical protein DFJ74DRAFT_705203 [Hyaloraphidium curvatum]